jgi:tetratricopeptide (TPR) repeat protein
MELPAVPASVTAMFISGKLPPGMAALFTPAGELADGTYWSHVASAVREYLAAGAVDEKVRGVLALVQAYACLYELDDCPDPDQLNEDNDRAVELLKEAEANGVDEDETVELWWYSEHLRRHAGQLSDYIEEMDAYIAKYGALPHQRLDAKLGPAHDLYSAGDRAAALALFREVAEISPWDSEFSGCIDRIDAGWCRLLHDAAHVEGPEAARKIWQEARAHFRAAKFPVTTHSWQLVEMLLGTGVPDLIEVIIYQWLEAAEEVGESDVPVTEDQQRIFELALAEIEEASEGG